jgi:DNA-binding MarR family transcriptional regulator
MAPRPPSSSTTTSPEQAARAANVLGALSLALVDRVRGAVADAGVDGETSAAALSALEHFLDAPTIGRLRDVVGRTSPATVRMVDRLVRSGFARRRGGDDARASHVVLTPAGRKLARRVSAARAGVLDEALAVLTPAERATFADLLDRVLEGTVAAKLERRASGRDASGWTCRLCDPGACRREHGECPAANAARRAATLD